MQRRSVYKQTLPEGGGTIPLQRIVAWFAGFEPSMFTRRIIGIAVLYQVIPTNLTHASPLAEGEGVTRGATPSPPILSLSKDRRRAAACHPPLPPLHLAGYPVMACHPSHRPRS